MWSSLLLAVSVLAAEPVKPAAADELAAMRLMLPRHEAASCQDLVAVLHEPAASLVRIAEHAQYPPWLATRAARCAAELPAARPALFRWLADPARAGLASVTLLVAPELKDPELLVRAALQGPHADLARRVIGEGELAPLLESP